jgi:D-alanine-D-alanine ligase
MKNIAIVTGGDSSEYGVSLKSAEGLYSFIDKDRYKLYIVMIRKGRWTVVTADGSEPEVDKDDFSFVADGQKIKFDYAYITIHGSPGEDGRLQGYLDLIGIPYSSCGVLASALTCNKFINNHFLKSQGVCVADSILVAEGQEIDTEYITGKLGLPVFVKPNESGSSFGVTKVKEASQMQAAVKKAFNEGTDVIIERFVGGVELTCGCYKTKSKQVIFPVTEVVTHNEFFDYDAKYNGAVDEITPARITDTLAETVQRETLKIYDLIGARGIVRVDYIVPDGLNPVLLEVNTTPGMTTTSFIPQQIRAAGLDIKDVMTDIIENI